MFSDSCPFCCQWWCPQSPPPSCQMSPAGAALSGLTHVPACLSVCVYIYIYLSISPIYIYHTSIYITHLSISPCLRSCTAQRSVVPSPVRVPRLCSSVSPVYDTGRCPLPWPPQPRGELAGETPPAPIKSPFSDLQGHSVAISSTPRVNTNIHSIP